MYFDPVVYDYIAVEDQKVPWKVPTRLQFRKLLMAEWRTKAQPFLCVLVFEMQVLAFGIFR